MRFRQVHLDFHTSEHIPDIGKQFDKKQFQEALTLGHVDSITLFSKCHHGWSYHPTVANRMHPELSFDLLGAQINAAHEINVKTPVYISAGFDEKYAHEHPEHLVRRREQVLNPPEDFSRAGYHLICFNSPYIDTLVAQVKEVCANYDADGLFLDITAPRVCYCKYCMKTLTERGLDPMDEKNARALSEETYLKYTSAIRQAADSIKPGMPIFHNSGSTPRGRRDLERMSSHNEIESLPTSSWGYDNLPMIAHYVQSHSLDYLGMTGKFHLSWGEFGGYKHPNALKWETALTVAHGAKCSIGDQLHPLGNMDPATYHLIGEAYAEIEQKEPWLDGVKAVTDIGLLSYDAWLLRHPEEKVNDKDASRVDVGALRILLEGKYLFDILDEESDFSSYKLLILPDNIRVDGGLREKLDAYIANGGKLLASGKSGLVTLSDGSYQFAYDFGAQYEGTREISPIYITPHEQIDRIGIADQVLYAPSEQISLCGGTALASIKEPYFARTAEHFCSHRHAPQDHTKISAGVTEGKDGIYIAEHIFREYAMVGSQFAKQLVLYAIDRCLGTSKTLRTALPAQAIVTLMDQPEQKRLILHVVYAPRNVKGINKIEVIEDCVPLYDVPVTLHRLEQHIKKVYLAPSGEEIAYRGTTGATFIIPKIETHAMIVLDYE